MQISTRSFFFLALNLFSVVIAQRYTLLQETKYTYNEAVEACHALGLKLAVVDDFSIQEISNVVPTDASFWIKRRIFPPDSEYHYTILNGKLEIPEIDRHYALCERKRGLFSRLFSCSAAHRQDVHQTGTWKRLNARTPAIPRPTPEAYAIPQNEPQVYVHYFPEYNESAPLNCFDENGFLELRHKISRLCIPVFATDACSQLTRWAEADSIEFSLVDINGHNICEPSITVDLTIFGGLSLARFTWQRQIIDHIIKDGDLYFTRGYFNQNGNFRALIIKKANFDFGLESFD